MWSARGRPGSVRRASRSRRRRRRATATAATAASGDPAESEASRSADAARGALRLEACPQPGRSFDLVSGALEKRDRPFLLGESVGKDRRSVDSRLELCAAFGRQRSVRERRELFLATPFHPHKRPPRYLGHTCKDTARRSLFPGNRRAPSGSLGGGGVNDAERNEHEEGHSNGSGVSRSCRWRRPVSSPSQRPRPIQRKEPRHSIGPEPVRVRLERGTLRVQGTEANDAIALRLAAGDPTVVQVDLGDDGTADFSFPRAAIENIRIDGARRRRPGAHRRHERRVHRHHPDENRRRTRATTRSPAAPVRRR